MSWRKVSTILALAAALGALGCGSNSSSGVSITVSPTTASVITNRTQQFSGAVTGNSNTAITWTLACATNVAANTCGSIDAAGLYTAPATVPTITSNGTTTVAPTVTITGTAQADKTKTATATLTIITGISIVITPTTATVGTGENFTFTATVNNPGCNTTSNPTCNNVTWSLSTTLTGIGSIGSTTGVYTAPATVPTSAQGGSTVIITATSVADTSVTATGTVTVVTASKPTVTSVSPNNTAIGAIFQDVYITGTNFISTDNVFVNNVQLASTFVSGVSTSLIRARIPDFMLAVPPQSGKLQISVSEQSGAAQTCTPDASLCQILVAGVRPGVVGPSPNTVPQGSATALPFNVDGGFFGTGANPASPAVTATFNGQLRGITLPGSQTLNSTRQLTVTIGGTANIGDFTVPGLYPVAVKSATNPAKFAVTNVAVQPTYVPPTSTRIPVGSLAASAPADVAVNPTTGMAVVANNGSNDISLINLTTATPTFIGNICTAAVGAAPPCPASGPTSVSVDYVRNIALVVNQTTKTIAVVDLAARAVTTVLAPFQDTPQAVGINPVSGRAIVAMQNTNYAALIDVTQNPPVFSGIVSVSTGTSPRVAIEPHLNWALVTPGGLGSLGIVDLSQQSTNVITAMSRTTNVVTVTVQSTTSTPPLAVQVGDAVQIQNIQFPGASTQIAALAPTFDGFFQVTSVGPGPNQFSFTQTGATETDVATQSIPQGASGNVNYAQPVATVGLPTTVQGVGINPETQQAVLVDPTTGGVVTFFSLIDQSVTSLTLKVNSAADTGTIAAAYNPLTNTVVAVNSFANELSVIDPTTPRRLNDNNLFATLPGPVAVAIDPGTNIAVVANQKDNSVSVLNLSAGQPFQSFSITETSPKTFLSTSSLGTAASPAPQQLTVIGMGLTCTNGSTTLNVRLDGVALPTSCVGTGNRELTATVPFSMLTSAHRFAVDVANSSGSVTNAEDFSVEQSVDVTACSTTPEPSGVSIDPVQNLAAVTLFGCNAVALINMNTGTGNTVVVGANPIGVAVLPRLHLAVVANNGGAGTASIVDELQQSVTQTVATGSGPIGAAADESTGEVAIANSVANTVTVVNAVTGGASSISTGQRPIAVAFNYVNHQVAVANSSSNSLGISAGSAGSQAEQFSVIGPTSVVYDPVPTDCGDNNNGTTTNTTGCFIVASSQGNSVNIIDPITAVQETFRMGVNPTAVAYNFRTSTLVSTNTASHTVTVADLLGLKVRSVVSLPPTTAANSNLALSLAFQGSLQYALDIHPFTNVAVIADTANGRVLFVPLPY